MEHRLLKNKKGTSTVEFAIVLPLLLLILFGIIECSLFLYDKAMITNASREGARAGIVFHSTATGDYSPLTQADISTVVNNYLATYLITFETASATTEVDPLQCPPLSTDPTAPPRLIKVTVKYPYTFLILPNFATLSSTLNLEAVTIMRCEG